MRVTAAVLRNVNGPLDVSPLELDDPRSGELVVRLVASGVAQSDLDAIAGRSGPALPFVPGSEAAGIVERVGDGVENLKAGDAVLVTYDFCGRCAACLAGNIRHCERFDALNLSGTRADGSSPFQEQGSPVGGFFYGQSSFATHIVCRAETAIAVASDEPLELLAPLCGDILTAAAPLLAHEAPIESLAIAGGTFSGLIAAMVAKALGVKMIVLAEPRTDRHPLMNEIGVTVAVDDFAALETATRSLSADGAQMALICTQVPGAAEACSASLAPGGTLASCLHQGRAEGQVGAPVDPGRMVPKLLAMRRDGQLPIEQLIEFFPFEQINEAISAVADARVVKAVLRFRLGEFGDLDRALEQTAASEEPSVADAPTGPAERDDAVIA